MYCRRKLEEKETFLRHVFVDECTVQLYSNKAYAYVDKNDPYAHIFPSPKYAMKVMVIGAISFRGPSHLVVMKTGRSVNALMYQKILAKTLLPWARVRLVIRNCEDRKNAGTLPWRLHPPA